MGIDRITIFLADDNVIVREGVRALLGTVPDLEVVGVGEDYDSLVAGATEHEPQVVVTDIRMPPNFQSEGIDAAKEIRKRNPGTGVVILSQFDDPEYAISLLSEGSEGYAYLLKDRVAEGDQLANAIRAVAAGGSVLDPKIVEAIVKPVTGDGGLSAREEELLRLIAEGKPIKRIAAVLDITPAAASQEVEHVLLNVAQSASAGGSTALKRLQTLHRALVDRDQVEETLGKLLPGGLAEKLRAEGRRIGETERMTVTVLMTDVRGYSGIAETSDPSQLASQLNKHRALLNDGILSQGGTVMQFTGDGVMAVFGAPFPQQDHADRALAASLDILAKQAVLNDEWTTEALFPFHLGIGLSTGEVAAALLGSEERLEYTLVGDTVNLSARLQDLARPGGSIVLSDATMLALSEPVEAERLDPTLVKGRSTPVQAHKIQVEAAPVAAGEGGHA